MLYKEDKKMLRTLKSSEHFYMLKWFYPAMFLSFFPKELNHWNNFLYIQFI
jgi:hypothetical protein